MKKLWFIGSIGIFLSSLILTGCGVPQEDYDTLLAEKNELSMELVELDKKYPLRDFDSLTELRTWVEDNDVSEKPDTIYAQDWYARALDIQEDAMLDGYMISADYDYYEEDDSYMVYCIALIGGRVFFWDPETDEIFEDTNFGTVE